MFSEHLCKLINVETLNLQEKKNTCKSVKSILFNIYTKNRFLRLDYLLYYKRFQIILNL